MRKIYIAILAILAAGYFSELVRANSVNFYIVTTKDPYIPTNAGTWQVYALDSNDNDGIASFDIDILATGGMSLTSRATLMAPQPVDPSGQYPGTASAMGFNTFTNPGTLSTGFGGTLTSITAAQNTVYGATDDPVFDMGVLVGVGQEPSSASPQNGTQGPTDGSGTPTGLSTPVWNWVPFQENQWQQNFGGTLIEQGTYASNGSYGYLTVALGNHGTGFVEMLNDAPPNDPWQDAGVSIGTFRGSDTQSPIPEPASISLIALGMGLLGTGRRFRRTAQIPIAFPHPE